MSAFTSAFFCQFVAQWFNRRCFIASFCEKIRGTSKKHFAAIVVTTSYRRRIICLPQCDFHPSLARSVAIFAHQLYHKYRINTTPVFHKKTEKNQTGFSRFCVLSVKDYARRIPRATSCTSISLMSGTSATSLEAKPAATDTFTVVSPTLQDAKDSLT